MFNIITGSNLLDMTKQVEKMEKRDCFSDLEKYLQAEPSSKACLLYGLRRTGKTTMIFQAIRDLSEKHLNEIAYIKAENGDSLDDLKKELENLKAAGCKYVFINEITLVNNFIDCASVFSDIYAAMGMKIVLSGTDSLGFYIAEGNELYDRTSTIHTTFIPFNEYERLLSIKDVDDYIHFGGTLKEGIKDFSIREEMPFANEESARKYIDTAICKNIQHSLIHYENGNHFRHLKELFDAGELTNAINRIIEDTNHSFVKKTITDMFKSHDLGAAKKNLSKTPGGEKYTDVLNNIDENAILKELASILDIKNKPDLKVDIRQEHIDEIKEYLFKMDLFATVDVRTKTANAKPLEHIIVTQPGMRYCQAEALVYSLMKDSMFSSYSEDIKQYITDKILNEVKGRMLEDIILYETSKTLGRDFEVFKMSFDRGEFDMVIYDKTHRNCKIYEIKHSASIVDEQAKHLRNTDFCKQIEDAYGKIVKKAVIYKGDNAQNNDITYINAEDFLMNIDKERELDENTMTIGPAFLNNENAVFENQENECEEKAQTIANNKNKGDNSIDD